eukprot:gene7775-635_t
MGWSRIFVRILSTKARYPIVLAWITILVVAGLFGLNFFDETSDTDDSLSHSSLSYKASVALFSVPFGDLDSSALMLKTPQFSLTELDQFYEQFMAQFRSIENLISPIVFETYKTTYFFNDKSEWIEYDAPKQHFLRNNSKALALMMTSDWDFGIEMTRILGSLSKEIAEETSNIYASGPAGITFFGYGKVLSRKCLLYLHTHSFSPSQSVIMDALESDLLIGDGISIPTALLVLCFTLRSSRYVFVPVISIAACILLSFLIMRPIANASAVSSVAPNLMMSLSIAMSVDYALFFFSRFREEVQRGLTVPDACVACLDTAGHTIFVSGATFIACTLTLLLIPVNLLSSLGVAAAITVACAVLVNLTFVPTMVMLFPKYFARATSRNKHCLRLSFATQKLRSYGISIPLYANSNNKNHGSSVHDDDDESNLLLHENGMDPLVDSLDSSDIETIVTRARESRWYRFGSRILKRPCLCIVVIALVSGVAFYPAVTFKHASGAQCECPQNSKFYKVNNYANPNNLRSMPDVELANFDGLAINYGRKVNFNEEHHFLSPSNYLHRSNVFYFGELQEPSCIRTCFKLNGYVSDKWDAVIVRPNIDGASVKGQAWIKSLRQKLAILSEHYNTTLHLARGGVVDVDMIDEVFARFHVAIAGVAAVVFFLMLLSFRSVAIAVKAVVSIALTQALVYGISTCVFEYGILDFLGWPNLSSVGGLCWISSILAFTILVGLGLDYHIFLLGRVVEFRQHGYDDRESVLLGLARTGRVITAAGVIMAIAFLGLLFSHEPLVQQLAFLIIVAVLIDTFVVRTILVPSMMAILGNVNWWPRAMPEFLTKQQPVRSSRIPSLSPNFSQQDFDEPRWKRLTAGNSH